MNNKDKWFMRTINVAWLGLFVFSVYSYLTGTVDEKIFILKFFLNMDAVMLFISFSLALIYSIMRVVNRKSKMIEKIEE